MANILNVGIVNIVSNWPNNATLGLIRYRREYHHYFEDHSNRDHNRIWSLIATRINNNYNFAPTPIQCRNKWYALKRGYENLRRIMDGNSRGYPINSPNNYDIRFHEELSDEFWTHTNQYHVDRCTYAHRERGRSRSPSNSGSSSSSSSSSSSDDERRRRRDRRNRRRDRRRRRHRYHRN